MLYIRFGTTDKTVDNVPLFFSAYSAHADYEIPSSGGGRRWWYECFLRKYESAYQLYA